MKPKRTKSTTPRGYTEQDLCDYAHHLWIQSGMRFDGDPWREARACLEANLPPCAAPAPAAGRVTMKLGKAVRAKPAPRPESAPKEAPHQNEDHSCSR